MHANSRFWRDPALPFVEVRSVADGRKVCYAAHSHESFSIGAITAGRSTYISGDRQQQVAAGTVVLMNPAVVHTCNPIAGEPWSYLMLFIDWAWLQGQGFSPLAAVSSTEAGLFDDLLQLFAVLLDEQQPPVGKEAALRVFCSALSLRLGESASALGQGDPRLLAAVEFIRAHCTEPLRLEDISRAAGLSASYLIRAFKQQFGLTPHGYLLDQRVQYARAQLRRGRLIAEVALEAGFADQAHLQRAFKRHLAATPGHYRSAH